MSSSPFSFWWSPPATVQIWSTHYPPWTGMHIWVLLSGSLQAGWRNQWGRVNHLIYVFLWNMAITPPSLLISSWWLACLPQRCGALVHPPIHTNSETSPWGTCAGGEKVKRRKTQTKHESMHSYSLDTLFGADSSLGKASSEAPHPALPSPHRSITGCTLGLLFSWC